MREVVAKRIIEMAQRGTRDPQELAGGAVLFLAANYRLDTKQNRTPQRRLSPCSDSAAGNNDILRAASTVHEAGEEPNSELVAKVVLPVLSIAEQEFGQAPSRISLDDMVQRAALNGHRVGRHEAA
jgi:hypothetical protein